MSWEPDIEVDYGSFTPESLDRFGTNQTWTVRDRESRRDLSVGNFRGRVKRLGLTLLYWMRHPYHQTETYQLDLNGRTLEIRSYFDGRIQLLVDDEPVYVEKMTIKTLNWVKSKVLEKRYPGNKSQHAIVDELHERALLDNVRFDLEKRRQKLNIKTE